MKREREDDAILPIACTLAPAEVAAMHDGLLPGLLSKASARERIPGGFRLRFNPQVNLVKEAGACIDAEHRCCRFLRFRLVVEPGDGPVWLEVTGPEGTEDFLSTLVDTRPGISPGR